MALLDVVDVDKTDDGDDIVDVAVACLMEWSKICQDGKPEMNGR